MSAGAAAEGGAALLSLYRAVLRVHRAKLPGPLRGLGDAYAASEFRAHLRGPKRATAAQLRQFAARWTDYVAALRGEAEAPASGELAADDLAAMSPAQRAKLEELRAAAEALARGDDGDDAPPAR